jgi:ABC-type uncharacterized transport system permease subunit
MSKINMVPVLIQYDFDATATVITHEVQENGWLQLFKVDLPNFSNSITAVLTIVDRNGYTLYTSGSLTKNQVTTVGDSITAAELGAIPVDYRYTFILTLSGAAGGTGGSAKVALYIKK